MQVLPRRHLCPVAQSVERATVNRKVIGSTPIGTDVLSSPTEQPRHVVKLPFFMFTQRENRLCQKCHQIKSLAPRQRVCDECQYENKLKSRMEWYRKNKSQCAEIKRPPASYFVKNSQWYWKANDVNLIGGPFQDMKSAVSDARKALL